MSFLDFLYGDADGKDLALTFEDLEDYKALEKWTSREWADLLDKLAIMFQLNYRAKLWIIGTSCRHHVSP